MNSKEALKTILINCKDLLVDKNGNVVKLEDLIKTIKQDLDRLEELEKAIEILKEVCSLNCDKTLETERQFLKLSQEEYELLKEVLNYGR